MEDELKIPFNEKLKRQDQENQTYGCRHTNPDICKNNNLEGICAFVTSDHICRNPSRSWARQYKRLKESELSNEK